MEVEAVSERRLGDSSKTFDKSKKAEVFSLLNDKFNTVLDSNTYRLVEKATFYDDQLAKQVAKWASGFQAKMKGPAFDPMDTYG